jgi:hypothetical protein
MRHYGDRVIINSGFYYGSKGEIISRQRINRNEYQFLVDLGKVQAWFYEEELSAAPQRSIDASLQTTT